MILVKAPLGSGKSYQARRFNYQRTIWLTTSRALSSETARVTGFTNYLTLPKSTPLSYIDRIVLIAPSLYRLNHDFKPYHCLIIDEAESFFSDMFSGLCKGSDFEIMMKVFASLMNTSQKIIVMDGFLANSALSVCASFTRNLQDIRLVISTYTIFRGTLYELPSPIRWTKKSPQDPNTKFSVEGLLNLIDENSGTDDEQGLLLRLRNGTMLWRIKVALLEENYKCFGPMNSVKNTPTSPPITYTSLTNGVSPLGMQSTERLDYQYQ